MTTPISNIVELRAPRARRAFELFIQGKVPATVLDFNIASSKYASSDVQQLWETWQAGIAHEKQAKRNKAKK